jgi:hypothetical protein
MILRENRVDVFPSSLYRMVNGLHGSECLSSCQKQKRLDTLWCPDLRRCLLFPLWCLKALDKRMFKMMRRDKRRSLTEEEEHAFDALATSRVIERDIEFKKKVIFKQLMKSYLNQLNGLNSKLLFMKGNITLLLKN